MKPHVLYIFLFLTVLKMQGQGTGNGQNGSPDINGTINSYTYLTSDAAPCNETLHVASTNAFQPNDLILIIQMQGASIDDNNTANYGNITNYNHAGNYELAEISSVTSNVLVLKYSLLNYYISSGSVQIVKIPQYKSPKITGSLTCPDWNGKTGGVLVLAAQDTVYLEKDIHVMGKGFRGAQHFTAPCIFAIRYEYFAESPDPRYYALKGEGIAFNGIGDFTSGRGAPANGGGGGNIHTTGGGGGSNYGCGGDGGWGYPVDTSGGEKLVFGLGGYALHYSTAENKIFMGGGGGAGHEHYGNGTSGANGGGIVIIAAKVIVSNGRTIFSMGNNSANGGAFGDGAGGAGAGGTVLLAVETIEGKLSVNTNGGSGGNTINKGFGPGGGGGGGICRVSHATLKDSIMFTSTGGNYGLAGGIIYGGSKGCDGSFLDNLTIPHNTTYPPVHADFSFSPEYFSYNEVRFSDENTIAFNNVSTGGSDSYWDFGDDHYDTLKHPTHTYSEKGYYIVGLKESNAMCSDSTQQHISTQLEMADVFTPNGDGENDLFPKIKVVTISSIIIYNRWGQEVFKGDASSYQWNGTLHNQPAPEGTYFYVIEFLNIDSEGKTITKGAVTLLR